MNSDEILALPAKVLEQSQRQDYYQQGYLLMPGLIDENALAPLRATMSRALEISCKMIESDHQFDLEQGHNAQNPRLRRAAYVDDIDAGCWEFCRDSVLADIATDILGPDIRFRDAMINFKWSGGGAEVKWHQDLAFYPHTNVGTCQFLVAMEDITSAQGPLQVIPGSHKGPIYSHYDDHSIWTGAISEVDLDKAGLDTAVELTGPEGSVTVHHSCAIHGSAQNMSDTGRPVFVISYSAADAIPYTAAPYPSSHYGELVRGSQPRYAHHQELQMPLPPDWSGGYTSIFSHQDEISK